ncbi:MAG: ribosome maturation factor RimM [Cellvibrionaceae bacterium]
MTEKSPLSTVGRIGSVFGVKGWVRIHSFTSPPEKLLEYRPWLLKTRHGIKEIEVLDSKIQGNGIVALFSGYEDRELAKSLATIEIAVDSSLFPSLVNGEFYWHQLEGLKVISVYDGVEHCLGRVSKLMETGANDVLVVQGKADADSLSEEKSIDNRERLIPYIDAVVISVDLDEKQIIVDWDPDF